MDTVQQNERCGKRMRRQLNKLDKAIQDAEAVKEAVEGV